jgi:hypothetical protein
MVLTTAEKWRKRRRRDEGDDNGDDKDDDKDDDAKRESQQAVSRLAPATGTFQPWAGLVPLRGTCATRGLTPATICHVRYFTDSFRRFGPDAE